MDNESNLKGVIYPLYKHNYELLKTRKNPIYIKYQTHSKSGVRIKDRDYIFFYISGGNKTIVGYSIIKDIKFELPQLVLDKFVDRTQMDGDEFNNYIQNRFNKHLLMVYLKKVINFDEPQKINFPITMTGKLINSVDNENLFENLSEL